MVDQETERIRVIDQLWSDIAWCVEFVFQEDIEIARQYEKETRSFPSEWMAIVTREHPMHVAADLAGVEAISARQWRVFDERQVNGRTNQSPAFIAGELTDFRIPSLEMESPYLADNVRHLERRIDIVKQAVRANRRLAKLSRNSYLPRVIASLGGVALVLDYFMNWAVSSSIFEITLTLLSRLLSVVY
ncbi:hypothetical protein GCM10023115_00300 [Pontixanthobacter gangjinensis]|uniref:Uncharacterized protein n=1 Tax=Pontixanthobacter gangjinensis TaxID=1028742 RepID=A0A6I4SJI9_9SPHN|nr:hypothetical protein [Pontixanthobacter gangjinensis]MXO55280.1 hypothetical protein [Pontixanthobacter gangjinensis]